MGGRADEWVDGQVKLVQREPFSGFCTMNMHGICIFRRNSPSGNVFLPKIGAKGKKIMICTKNQVVFVAFIEKPPEKQQKSPFRPLKRAGFRPFAGKRCIFLLQFAKMAAVCTKNPEMGCKRETGGMNAGGMGEKRTQRAGPAN